TYPHNFFLHIGAELGLIGFAIIAIMVIWVLMRLYSRLRDPLVTAVAMLTLFALVSAQLSNDLYDNRWLWGMLLLGGAVESAHGMGRHQVKSGEMDADPTTDRVRSSE